MRRRIVLLQRHSSSEHLVACVLNAKIDTFDLRAEYEECGGSLSQFSYS